MSVPLQTVPDDQESGTGSLEKESVSQAKHEAAEIIARAHRQAEAITAEARSVDSAAPSPLAALGDNAEEIIGQVRKLIKKQRELQTERQEMENEIAALKSERDELVHRLTDAVERMEELAALADGAQASSPMPMHPQPAPPPPPPYQDPPPPRTPEPAPRPEPVPEPSAQDDTSLAARLKKAEQADSEDTSLAARLKRAEQEENLPDGHPEQEQTTVPASSAGAVAVDPFDDDVDSGSDGRSFYDRHSAKLPRLEGDGGHSVLSAMGGMRPEPDTKSRKGRRGRKK